MPREWRLVCSTAGSIDSGPSNGNVLASTKGAVHDESAALYQRPEQQHVEGVSYSKVALPAPRSIRIVQLQLALPQLVAAAGRSGYSIRQVMVVGPPAPEVEKQPSL